MGGKMEKCSVTNRLYGKCRIKYNSYPDCRNDGNSIIDCAADSTRRNGKRVLRAIGTEAFTEALKIVAKKLVENKEIAVLTSKLLAKKFAANKGTLLLASTLL